VSGGIGGIGGIGGNWWYWWYLELGIGNLGLAFIQE
jgi:hypothetical protein